MDAKRAFSLLKKIGFTRMGGTEEELAAAKILAEEVKSIGGQARIEEFDVNAQTIKTQKMFADGVEYEVVAYGNSGSTPKEGLTAPFYYMEFFDNDIAKFEAKGKIVLTNSYMSLATYKSLADTGCVGFITFGGDVLDKKTNSDLMTRELRQPLKDYKTLPGVNMRAADAMKLVKQKPKNITICIEQDEFKSKSRNVIAEIPGDLEETVVFTAHYDSVNFSKGVYDNGSGSVLLMEMYRHYLKNHPRRTLRFIWTGSEERGLLGSKSYIATHEKDLEKIVLCINVDVGAPVLGIERILVTAEESLTHAIDYMAKELGYAIQVKTDIYSSDAIPFADKGIPGVNFMRDGALGCNHIHDRNDTMFYLSSDALKSTGEFLEKFADRYINSYVFPVPRKIPDDIKKKVDKYLNPIKDLQ